MKKLLFIIDSMNGGGAERALLNLISTLDHTMFQVDILLLYAEGPLLAEARANATIYNILGPKQIFTLAPRISLRRLTFWIKYQALRRFPGLVRRLTLGKRQYDAEIAFLDGIPIIMLANWSTKAKRIGWIHSDMAHFHEWPETYSSMRKLDHLVCVSRQSAESLFKRFPAIDQHKTSIIHNAIPYFQIRQEAAKHVSYPSAEGIVIIGIGRLVPQKRFDRLLHAFFQLPKTIQASLWILGEGPELTNLEQIVSIQDASRPVHFLGFQSNPYPFMRKADIIALASDYEAFPVVIEEALVLGKPIVATRCAGVEEMIENGKTGIVTEITLEGFASGLCTLCENRQLRRKFEEQLATKTFPFDPYVVRDQFIHLLGLPC